MGKDVSLEKGRENAVNKKKLLATLLSVAMTLSLAAPAMAAEEKIMLISAPVETVEAPEAAEEAVILYTNDSHTYVDNTYELDEENEIDGIRYSTVAALKDSIPGAYLVDAGDHVQGTAYGSMDKGKTIIDLMNATGYDLATLGNHEFDYGMDGMKNVAEWAEYPYVSCNFFDIDPKTAEKTASVLDSVHVAELAGLKVAFVGITTPESFTKSTPAYFQNEKGEYIYDIAGGEDGADLYACVQAAIEVVEETEAPDYIIALGHLGVDEASKPWTSKDVIANTTGLDAFIDGHSHTVMAGEVVLDKEGNEVLLTQTGEYLGAVGKMTLTAEGITTELLTMDDLKDLTPDAEVKAIEDAWIAQLDEELGQVIGSIDDTLDNYDADGKRLVRKQETNTGDFAADALYYLFDNMGLDVDFAIMNGGGVRNKAITGDITYKTCKEIHTFGNVACLQTVTGQQILDALEWGARGVASGEEIGGFLHVSGLKFTIDGNVESTVQMDEKGVWTGAPTGAYCVKDVQVWDKETEQYVALDLEAEYNLAGYNYTLRDLGDGFAMFDGAVNVLDYVMEDYMVLANYVQSFEDGKVTGYAEPMGRITIERDVMADYKDVPADAWYADAVRAVVTAGSMKGTDKGFEPESKLTLASVYQMIYNMAGKPEATGNVAMADGVWFADAMNWAAGEGLYTGTEFADRVATREETVAVLYAYLGNGEKSNITMYYTDAADVTEMDAFKWACSIGLIHGNEKSQLMPKGQLSRAEMAQMLCNMEDGVAHVAHADWDPTVKTAINDFMDTYANTENAYVVFDFDNTCSIFDVEEQLAVHQLKTMTFAFTPEELPSVLMEGIGDLNEIRENDYSEPASYQAWINDITAAYTYLYENYGPFTAKGLDEAAQAKIQADPQWTEFATKMRAMYAFVGDMESAAVSYPWVLYWFTGMTEQEVYELAYASHKKYEAIESSYETWTSPAEIESEAGVVSIEITNGTCVSENIRELWATLDANGIDVWVCSASATDPIRAAIDAFGLHDYCTGMIAMTNVVGEDGKYVHEYDYVNGCGWLATEDGWVRDDAPIEAQTQGVGKVTAICNAIYPKYGCGPLAGFMDSTGDYNFCTEFENLKLVINFNRASRKVTDGGGVIAELAIYQRDTLGYDLAKANAAGDTLYVMQGREENGLRGFRPSDKTMRLDKTEELLFRGADNETQLQYMIDNKMTTEEVVNTFAMKTAADAEGNTLGFKYGFLTEFAGYHNIKDDVIYVAGASWEEKVEGETKVYTYNAVVNGEITEIVGNGKKFDGPYNALIQNENGVYTKMSLVGTEYEIVVGDFTKAEDGVITLGGEELVCAEDVVLYVIDLEGNITVGSVDEDYKGNKNYTIKVMYTMNEDGVVDAIYVRQNASKNYTTEAELLKAAEKAGMTSAVLTDTHGNRANVKYFAQDEQGEWNVVFDVTSDSWCGRSGTSDAKREGDGASPTGIYPVFLHFGTLPSPEVQEGVSYTQLENLSHFWVDGEVDNSGLYNKFLVTENAAESIPTTAYGDYDYVVLNTTFESKDDLNARREGLGFNSQERLYEETVAYAYSSSIEYNTNWVLNNKGEVTYKDGSIVNGYGSCIFFHCQSGGATAGCISIPEANYETFLETVDAMGAMIAIN